MLAPNTRLRERYRIIRKIGGGGFGYVYLAMDEVFGCSVAIKETKEEVAGQDKLRKAFEREAKLLRNLKHDSLPRVTDYFFHDQAQFLVMDFIEGEDLATSLQQRLRKHQRPFSWQEVLPWADKILAALEYLHTRFETIVHRDIKPSNIKLTEEGEIYLLDFGLAKGSTGQMSTVIDGQPPFSIIGGTRGYAPIEQLQDGGTEPRSDIYAFGATLYELLTGQLPISAGERDEAIQRGQSDPLRPAHEVNNAVPLTISQVISDALAVRWWDRIDSAKGMRTALALAATEVDAAQADPKKKIQDSPSAPGKGENIQTLKFSQPQIPMLSTEVASSQPVQSRVKRLGGRRLLLAAGLSLFVVAAAGFGIRWAVQRWFTPAVATTPESAATHASEKPKSLPIVTPADLRLVHILPGHKGIVWSVAFSPDGNLAASASEDNTIILWDTRTWKPKFSALTEHAGAVYAVAFSPDGKILASGSFDQTIKFWDTQTGKLIRTLLPGNTNAVLSLAFSPVELVGDSVLASITGKPGVGGEEIRLWYSRLDWRSRALPFKSTGTEGFKNEIFTIAFSPDGNTLATAGYGTNIRLWNAKDEGQSRVLNISQPENAFVSRLTFSADGKFLASGNWNGTITLWRTNAWEAPEQLGAEHKGAITAIAFSPDNATLVSASSDKTIRLWNVATRTSSRVVLSSGKILQPQQSLAFSPDGQILLSGGDDQMVNVWQGSEMR